MQNNFRFFLAFTSDIPLRNLRLAKIKLFSNSAVGINSARFVIEPNFTTSRNCDRAISACQPSFPARYSSMGV